MGAAVAGGAASLGNAAGQANKKQIAEKEGGSALFF